jgi:glycosyltransferase involved in cell wall biosynthesis
MTSICLNMIVKNESAIIQRCLKSVSPFISTWVIHDTGSTDDTCELIQNYFDDVGIPGVLTIDVPFKDFEFNRNAALHEAMEQKGVDYVLLIDADMELVTNLTPYEFWDKLIMPVYRVSQKGSSLCYFNTRIIGKVVFGLTRYKGVTHEFLGTGHIPSTNLPSEVAYMHDYGDGGCKADKFIRDRCLLEDDLATDPENTRSRFYLAQTYKDLGEIEKSIAMYRKYLENPGWEEEGWYAQYMICDLYKRLGDIPNFLSEAIKAFEKRRHRSEPLYKLTELCRLQNWHMLGWMFGVMGNKIEFPRNDSLFIDTSIYSHLFLYELSILAYYTGRINEGLEITNNLLLTQRKRGGYPKSRLHCLQKNLQFYIQRLPHATHTEIHPTNTPEGWNCMNPGLLVDGDHLLLNVRIVNYIMTKQCVYSLNTTHQQTGISVSNPIRTRNLRCTYEDGNLSDGVEYFVSDHEFSQYPNICMGYEDMRLFRFRGETWFAATVRQIVKTGLNTIAIGNNDKLFLIDSPTPGRCEKNWLPFEHQGELLVIYNYDPFIVIEINTENGTYETVVEQKMEYNFNSFRGSGSPVKVPGGYYFVIHEVLPHYNAPRHYVHRALFMDDNLTITHVSKPFNLLGAHQIEYVSGLAILGDTVYITWGEMDRKAYLTSIPFTNFEEFCKADGCLESLPLRLEIS